MVRCPEGHESEATDYCDTCGSPIEETPAPEQPGSVLGLGEPVAAPTQTCPHCGALNVADALFCETCGYDFTTGAAPLGEEPDVKPDEAGETVQAEEPETSPEQPDPTSGQQERSEPELEPAANPEAPDRTSGEQERSEPEPEPEPEPASELAPETVPEPEADPTPEPERTGEVAAHARPRHTPPSRDLADTWVVEVWVDPDWYAVQQTAEACPSAGVPDVVAVQRSVVLVGRPSGSLGVRPEVDAGADSAVSRRHAQLTSDGRRWWIEDLGSSNGTYVGTVGEPLPTTALTPGRRVEIDRDDRIYVGAWTRLVLRQATESERRGTG